MDYLINNHRTNNPINKSKPYSYTKPYLISFREKIWSKKRNRNKNDMITNHLL